MTAPWDDDIKGSLECNLGVFYLVREDNSIRGGKLKHYLPLVTIGCPKELFLGWLIIWYLMFRIHFGV